MFTLVVHPGDVLRDELAESGITPTAFARLIDVPPNRVGQIIAGKRSVTRETALRFGLRCRASILDEPSDPVRPRHSRKACRRCRAGASHGRCRSVAPHYGGQPQQSGIQGGKTGHANQHGFPHSLHRHLGVGLRRTAAAAVTEFEIILEQCGSLLKKRLQPYFASNRQANRLTFKDAFRHRRQERPHHRGSQRAMVPLLGQPERYGAQPRRRVRGDHVEAVAGVRRRRVTTCSCAGGGRR